MKGLSTLLERVFKLSAKNTTVKTEILAGLTTFITMSYIIFINPSLLAAAGIPREAAFAATIWASVISSLIMGLWANYPVALAPGMGLNAFFTYTVVLNLGFSWPAALGAFFVSGLLLFILTMGGLRRAIINAVPENLRKAIGVGIGLFIAFIGLQSAGIVVADPATLLSAGNIVDLDFEIGRPAPLLALIGLVFTSALIALKMRGAILLGIIFTMVLGMGCGAIAAPTSLADLVSARIPSFSQTFLALDFKNILSFGFLSVVFTITMVGMCDNLSTLIGLSRKANLVTREGRVVNLDRGLQTAALGAVVSAVLGTSSTTSYIENAAGVAEGGRTGLTAITVAVMFIVALFFAPLVELVPAYAIAPALIVVGCLMMSEVTRIQFTDFTEGLPAFLTIIIMPMTYSIANGFAFGFIGYVLLKVLSGNPKEVNRTMWFISLAFIGNFILHLY